MTEKWIPNQEERLMQIERELRDVVAASWSKIDGVDLSKLNVAIGRIQAEIDYLRIIQGKEVTV